jgi:hypothetical protein
MVEALRLDLYNLLLAVLVEVVQQVMVHQAVQDH